MVEKPEEYQYSSYKSFISNGTGDISYQDSILSIISKDGDEARKKYKAFVENAIGKDQDNPFTKVYGGVILGGKEFIKEILKMIKDEQLRDKEISHRRALNAVGMEDIIEAISDYFQMPKEQILGDDSDERKKIALYMIKKHTGATNRQIGEYFQGLSYSAVAKIHQRFSERLNKDSRLKRVAEKIENQLSYVKV